MIRVWGRNTSVNVQKVMWALGELGVPHERIDVGGSFGKNNEPAYLAMNPNGLEPTDPNARARAGSWMDWQISVAAPAVTPVFWGLVRTPPEKRDAAAIEAGKVKSMAAMKILDAQLAKSAFVAGDALSMGDIPVALMAYRFRRLVPERPGLDNLERWFTAIEQRPAFKEHVLAIPFV